MKKKSKSKIQKVKVKHQIRKLGLGHQIWEGGLGMEHQGCLKEATSKYTIRIKYSQRT
jgi:hypothetical protein